MGSSRTCGVNSPATFPSNTSEGVQLARRALELEPGNLRYQQTVIKLLVSTGSWEEALPFLRRFLEGGDEGLHERIWNDTINLFREAVQAGRAADAQALLDDTTAGQRWRPLREALAAVVAGSPEHLNAVAPEVCEPAQKILAQLTGD